MNPLVVIQILTALMALIGQATPLIEEAIAAIKSGDQASLDALLAKIQAANDKLGAA